MPAKEHEIVTGIVIVIIVFLLAAFFILALVTYYNKRKKGYILEKQTMQNNFQQELLQTQLEIQEQTFQNISQEIHDNIGQALSFVKLNINMIDLNQTEAAGNKLEESKKLLTKAIQDLRDLSKMLNTDFINETGLAAAIEQQLLILQKTGLYTIEFIIIGQKEKYQLQRELVTFRVVQELLNNIVKHAEATAVTITMDYQFDKLVITVTDNGKGFENNSGNTGLGLRNIHNRIRLIKGNILFNSVITKGTITSIELYKMDNEHEKI
jgi:two-component system NarL family sensor kinase